VFKLTPHTHGWSKQAVHRFQGTPHGGTLGGNPVVFDAAGNLYGTSEGGGTSGGGIVFEVLR
jgi:hypothetical protein